MVRNVVALDQWQRVLVAPGRVVHNDGTAQGDFELGLGGENRLPFPGWVGFSL